MLNLTPPGGQEPHPSAALSLSFRHLHHGPCKRRGTAMLPTALSRGAATGASRPTRPAAAVGATSARVAGAAAVVIRAHVAAPAQAPRLLGSKGRCMPMHPNLVLRGA